MIVSKFFYKFRQIHERRPPQPPEKRLKWQIKVVKGNSLGNVLKSLEITPDGAPLLRKHLHEFVSKSLMVKIRTDIRVRIPETHYITAAFRKGHWGHLRHYTEVFPQDPEDIALIETADVVTADIKRNPPAHETSQCPARLRAALKHRHAPALSGKNSRGCKPAYSASYYSKIILHLTQ